jgi:hypothetical protein
MFDDIKVPPNHEAVVNGKIKEEKRFRPGRNDHVYFVNFAPTLIPISVETTCKEGIPLKLAVEVRVEIPKGNLAEATRDWGCADRRQPVTITTADIVKRLNLVDSLKSCVTTFVRDTAFFTLEKRQDILVQLQQRVQNECARARLSGEVLSCDPVISVPSDDLLGRLKADPGRKPIADYFIEQLNQKALLGAQIANFANQAEIKKAHDRADLKLAEQTENDRVEDGAAQMKVKADARDEAARRRNKDLLILSADLDFQVKQHERQKEMGLLDEDIKLAEKNEKLKLAEREQKRLDIEAEEGQRAKILGRQLKFTTDDN